MKKLITLLVFGSFISTNAQTILYSENFEGVSTFTLNTADYFSTTTGYNDWYINNSYTGGSFTDNICFTGTINVVTTPSQPAGITGFPNSKYLHICDNDAFGQGVTNCNFAASDGAIVCNDDENYFARMTSDISTVGYMGVTLSFYWLCAGSANNYGEVYYSTNSGTSWTVQQTGMQGQNSWIQSSQANAAWDNQATLRFGFRFANNLTLSASDPAFAVDEISVFVAPNTITPGVITPAAVCAGSTINIPYTISGTFTAGNLFTAELSDFAGSFAAPTSIGTLSSTAAGTITGTIPLAQPAGVNYLVRITSTNPAVTGSNSAQQIILDCSGIEDQQTLKFSIYPNPSKDIFTISIDENVINGSNMTVFNMVGQTIYSGVINDANTVVSASALGLTPGIYLVQIKHDDLKKVARLIIE